MIRKDKGAAWSWTTYKSKGKTQSQTMTRKLKNAVC